MFFAYRDLSLALLIVLAALPVVRAVFARRRSERRAAKRTARAVVRIGRYRVRRQLGAGGMGVVYEACDAKRGERVAVKVVRGELTARRLERFEREIRMLERVRHPNVVSLRDHGVERDGSRYLAMERLDGADLQQVLDAEGALEPRRVVRILRELCEALVAVHDAGVVHRDIKPANVFVCDAGSSIKLLDFGLASHAGDETIRSDEIVGSPYTMAPECFTDPASVGPQADLYAVGVLGHTLLAGAPPFASGGLIDIAAQHLYAEPPSLLAKAPGASAELRAVVARCLEKNAARRPVSARALLRALSACPEAQRPPASARMSFKRAATSGPGRYTSNMLSSCGISVSICPRVSEWREKPARVNKRSKLLCANTGLSPLVAMSLSNKSVPAIIMSA